MWVIVIQNHNYQIQTVYEPVEYEQGLELLSSWGFSQIGNGDLWLGTDLYAVFKEADPLPPKGTVH